MSRRPPYHPRRRDAERRGIVAQAMQRALAAAEVHRDRARAGLARLEGQIAERESLGLSVEAELNHLARLRIALDSAEADLTAARFTLRQDRAA